MAFLNDSGLATQISTIKAYVQSQINAATSVLNTSIAAMTPVAVGTVQAFAGSVVPEGWLLCDGSAISRTTYEALFNIIGNTYGSGDGETTFNLPDLINKFIEGSTAAGTEKAAGLPNITGVADGNFLCSTVADGKTSFATGVGSGALRAYTKQISNKYAYSSGTYWGANVGLDASASNAIYGNSTTVQPPAVTMKYIIKY